MKNLFFISAVLFIGVGSGFAENMEARIKRNQREALPKFPIVDTREFGVLQPAAYRGDISAQEKLPAMLLAHVQEVYKPLSKNGGLLFSLRRPLRGYDDATNNYAVNLEHFFEETTSPVRIKKRDFAVTTTNGMVFQVRYPEYRPVDASIEVIKDGSSAWIALTNLIATDKRFFENLFADDIFKSEEGFVISSIDTSNKEVERRKKDRVSSVHKETGEKVEGAFASVDIEGVSRKIILENKSRFSLENLVVEYQSFAEQTLMKMPKDFPSDYRCAGFFEIQSLAPGERKELVLNLPETVEAKQESINTGSYEYYQFVPANRNQSSEGRIQGVWVKVHRFTPYGEKLTREYKSASVPHVDWVNVAPAGADIR